MTAIIDDIIVFFPLSIYRNSLYLVGVKYCIAANGNQNGVPPFLCKALYVETSVFVMVVLMSRTSRENVILPVTLV